MQLNGAQTVHSVFIKERSQVCLLHIYFSVLDAEAKFAKLTRKASDQLVSISHK